MKITSFVITIAILCIGVSAFAQQHGLQVDNGLGQYSTILGSSSGGTYTLASGGGYILTSAGGAFWLTAGNPLTGFASNTPNEFFGSTNNYDLVFETNGFENLRIQTGTGNVTMNTGTTTIASLATNMVVDGNGIYFMGPTDLTVMETVPGAPVYLPDPSVKGKVVTIKDGAAGPIIVLPFFFEAIEGLGGYILNPPNGGLVPAPGNGPNAITLTSDGTNWWIIGESF